MSLLCLSRQRTGVRFGRSALGGRPPLVVASQPGQPLLLAADGVAGRRIAVHRNAVQVGQDFEVGQTKGKENRTVPVAASVLSRLAARCEGRSASDLLFPARGGGYLKRPSYDSTGWFNRAVERAKVQTVTPHDLRHTCASLAISAGANVLAVSRMLGHKDPSVTLRVYSDLFDSDLDAVAVNLDAKITDSVQSVSKAPADRRRKRTKTAI
jgi:integrase